jgi:mono/diheme cytochrome c family protein
MAVRTPIESRPGLPPWAIGITVFVLLVGGVYVIGNLVGENPAARVPGASQPGPADPAQVGGGLAEQMGCQSCHGQDWTGGVGPGLLAVEDGPVSENLQDLAAEHPENWLQLWIDGTGPEVEGLDRGGMPVFGQQLEPEQIDAIVAYLLSLD